MNKGDTEKFNNSYCEQRVLTREALLPIGFGIVRDKCRDFLDTGDQHNCLRRARALDPDPKYRSTELSFTHRS